MDPNLEVLCMSRLYRQEEARAQLLGPQQLRYMIVLKDSSACLDSLTLPETTAPEEEEEEEEILLA